MPSPWVPSVGNDVSGNLVTFNAVDTDYGAAPEGGGSLEGIHIDDSWMYLEDDRGILCNGKLLVNRTIEEDTTDANVQTVQILNFVSGDNTNEYSYIEALVGTSQPIGSVGLVAYVIGVDGEAFAGSEANLHVIGLYSSVGQYNEDTEVTNLYGIFIEYVDVYAPCENAYGIKITDVVDADNNFAIKTGLGKVEFGDFFTTRCTTEPADADINDSEVAFWFDDTEGSPVLKIKGKDSAGDVYTADVELS